MSLISISMTQWRSAHTLSTALPGSAIPFIDPPRGYGPVPFWFWNDDLEEGELLRQLRAFHAAGCDGVVLHPRPGLGERIGYLTPEFFRLVRLVVEEAERLGMKIVLYDEGSYPSGSACGQVVREDPTLAARCLYLREVCIEPGQQFACPPRTRVLTDRLVAAIAARRDQATDRIAPESLTQCNLAEYEVILLPEGVYDTLFCVWDAYSGGTMRGLGEEQDDWHATAPAAADILNPAVVERFMALTHHRYAEVLAPFMGSTVVAMFTDEPSPMGRDPKPDADPRPYSSGLIEEVSSLWGEDAARWLPALWRDVGEQTSAFRTTYDQAVQERLNRSFYGPISRWCEREGIALTGHPRLSNELTTLRHFHWPGQDMIHRWVLPGSPNATEGPDSVAPRVATSGKRVDGQARAATEAMGGYLWSVSFDELKWVLDWHMVRGNDLIMLHAMYYSVRGRRRFESAPDFGIHHVWWPYFPLLARHLSRVCYVLRECEHDPGVGVLVDGGNVSWRAASVLQASQSEFTFLDASRVDEFSIFDGELRVGACGFSCVVIDGSPANEKVESAITCWESQGITVIREWRDDNLTSLVRAVVAPALAWEGEAALRAFHGRLAGRHVWVLHNEGEADAEGELTLTGDGPFWVYRPWDNRLCPLPGVNRADRYEARLEMSRHELVILVEAGDESSLMAATPRSWSEFSREIETAWEAATEEDDPRVVPAMSDWSRHAGLELMTGVVCYAASFDVTPQEASAHRLTLDMGRVGEIAEVWVNEKYAGVAIGKPYRLDITDTICEGRNRIKIRVTNSMANRLYGSQRPSGLMGPLRLIRHDASAAPEAKVAAAETHDIADGPVSIPDKRIDQLG